MLSVRVASNTGDMRDGSRNVGDMSLYVRHAPSWVGEEIKGKWRQVDDEIDVRPECGSRCIHRFNQFVGVVQHVFICSVCREEIVERDGAKQGRSLYTPRQTCHNNPGTCGTKMTEKGCAHFIHTSHTADTVVEAIRDFQTTR